jgi:hypothetical protein
VIVTPWCFHHRLPWTLSASSRYELQTTFPFRNPCSYNNNNNSLRAGWNDIVHLKSHHLQ